MRHLISDILCGVHRTHMTRTCDAHALRIPCDPRADVRGTGYHKHKCDACGHTWAHHDALMAECNASEHEEGHTCAACGAEQYLKYGRF